MSIPEETRTHHAVRNCVAGSWAGFGTAGDAPIGRHQTVLLACPVRL